MKCPYCISEIDDSALACPHCTRDLYLFKPLLAQLHTLESELAGTKERLAKLELQLAKSETAAGAAEALERPEIQVTPDTAPDLMSWIKRNLWLWLTPLLMIVGAHFLITVALDLNMLWLRIVSLLIPLPFGYLLMSRSFHPFPESLLIALLVSCAAVVSMSWVVHLVDGTAIFPEEANDWQEFIEYAASIWFSFTSGMVIGRREWRRQQITLLDNFIIRTLVGLVTGSKEDIQKVTSVSRTINDISRSVTATATVLSALYTGLHRFL